MLRPLMVPEVNGTVGADFIRQLSQIYRYPEIYRMKSSGRVVEKQTETLGFASSKQKKGLLLGNLARQYAVGRFINHSSKAIDEAKEYIRFANGSIGPAALVAEDEDAMATHGDRVIADALCCWPGNEFSQEAEEKKPGSPLDMIHLAPPGSQGHRMHNKELYYHKLRNKGKKLADLKLGQRFRIKEYT